MDVSGHAGLFQSLSRGGLVILAALHWPALRHDPAPRLPRGYKHYLVVARLALHRQRYDLSLVFRMDRHDRSYCGVACKEKLFKPR